jgi:hypothetical protein
VGERPAGKKKKKGREGEEEKKKRRRREGEMDFSSMGFHEVKSLVFMLPIVCTPQKSYGSWLIFLDWDFRLIW